MIVLPRRTLLRGMIGGLSAVVGLPLLEAMLNRHGDALAGGGALPCRFISYFFGNGFGTGPLATAERPDAGYMRVVLEPDTVGPGYEAKPYLSPLFDRNVNDYCSLMTGWDNKTTWMFGHHEGMSVFSGYDPFDLKIDTTSKFYSKAGGPTIDQVIADAIGDETPTRSIQIATASKCRSWM